MPNHITNRLWIKGKGGKEILESLYTNRMTDSDGDENCFDFNKIIKRPIIFEGTTGGSVTWDIKRELNALAEKHKGEKLEFKLTELAMKYMGHKDEKELLLSIECFKYHGVISWYDWAIKYWGTKWNAYQTIIESDCRVTFDTAWSTPEPVIYALSKKFPKNKFTLRYADEDIGSNCGRYSYKNGECLEDFTPSEATARSYALNIKNRGYLNH